MIARVLAEADAPAFYSLRQRALREHPEAFGMSPEEVGPVEVVGAPVAPAPCEGPLTKLKNRPRAVLDVTGTSRRDGIVLEWSSLPKP